MNELEKLFKELNEQLLSSNAEKLEQIKRIQKEGTRKHPKAVNREAYGIIKGNWVYLEDCKKSLSGKYVRVVKKFDRSPRGTAQIFKNIEKGLRK